MLNKVIIPIKQVFFLSNDIRYFDDELELALHADDIRPCPRFPLPLTSDETTPISHRG